MRRHFLDNIRWVTVLLVLVYHVVYFFNNKGVAGGIGGFFDNPKGQPQDVVMYILYPWFMMLLFLVAGISSRYALEKGDFAFRQFVRVRTRKLLVPATVGIVVFQWMTGYFNIQQMGYASGVSDAIGAMPPAARPIACIFSGIGPLWFVQDLWFFSLLLALVVVVEKDWIYGRLRRLFAAHTRVATGVALIVGFFLMWGGAQVCFPHPKPASLQLLFNGYRPVAYMVPFLLGYYVFSHDSVQERLSQLCVPMLVLAVVAGTILVATTWGQDNTTPLYLMDWRTNLYAWAAMLAMIGCFKAWPMRESAFTAYMTRSSYGLYVVHYLVVVSVGYMLRAYTSLPPVADYLLLLIAVLLLSPAIYQLISRIPFVRWCVLGIKR